MLPENSGSGSQRAGPRRVGRAEYSYRRLSQGSRDVHRSRIIADKPVSQLEQRYQLADAGFSGGDQRARARGRCDRCTLRTLLGRTYQDAFGIVTLGEVIDELDEMHRRPLLGGTERSGGGNGNQGRTLTFATRIEPGGHLLQAVWVGGQSKVLCVARCADRAPHHGQPVVNLVLVYSLRRRRGLLGEQRAG